MTLNIGEVIKSKRKEKSWTQEQLAEAVGVSTPAVSKWETGTTYPDITLLSPIARALNATVDELLSFQNELSSADVSELAKKAAHTYESEGFAAGWDLCERLLQEYPNSIHLKFQLGGLFQGFMLLDPDIRRQQIQSYYRRAATLYEEVLSSGHPQYSYPSTIILAAYYVVLDDLDRAEELLKSVPTAKVDPVSLHISILALRGRRDEAMKETQESIRRYVGRAGQALGILGADARERGDIEKASKFARLSLELAELFGIRDGVAYPNVIKTLIAQDDAQGALDRLEAYVQAIRDLSFDYADNPVFDRLTAEPGDPAFVRKMLAQSILVDEEYAPLREETRYLQAARKLSEIVEAATHAFG